MTVLQRSLVFFAVVAVLFGIQSCWRVQPPSGTYQVITFEFVLSNPPANAGTAVPGVWIDTNTKLSGLSGGTLTSSLPCAVMIDYTDNTWTFKSVEFTSVKITYDDGTVDLSTGAVKLPLRLAAREYETVNSVTGGRIVKSKNWILSGEIPNIVTRAEPFRLQMEGYFAKDDNSRVAFTIDQHFIIQKDNATKSAAEVLQDK